MMLTKMNEETSTLSLNTVRTFRLHGDHDPRDERGLSPTGHTHHSRFIRHTSTQSHKHEGADDVVQELGGQPAVAHLFAGIMQRVVRRESAISNVCDY